VAAPKREYQTALDIQRQLLTKIAEDRSVNKVKSLYDRAQAELEAKLRRIPGREDTFSAYQQRILLAQTRQGQAQIAQKMAGELGDLSKQAQVASLKGLIKQVDQTEKIYTGAAPVLPIEEASRFWGVIDKRRTSLLKAHNASMNFYGKSVVGAMEQQLALSLATGETTDKAIDRIQEVADNKWYQAERIVRTEQAWAYNATHADGVESISDDIPDMMMRWTEHVTDQGKPLDNRVGQDSIVLHGQVAEAGGMFTMPSDLRVNESMWGERWSHPPNRPNDRAVLTAWRPSWGGLAWTFRNGRKEILSR